MIVVFFLTLVLFNIAFFIFLKVTYQVNFNSSSLRSQNNNIDYFSNYLPSFLTKNLYETDIYQDYGEEGVVEVEAVEDLFYNNKDDDKLYYEDTKIDEYNNNNYYYNFIHQIQQNENSEFRDSDTLSQVSNILKKMDKYIERKKNLTKIKLNSYGYYQFYEDDEENNNENYKEKMNKNNETFSNKYNFLYLDDEFVDIKEEEEEREIKNVLLSTIEEENKKNEIYLEKKFIKLYKNIEERTKDINKIREEKREKRREHFKKIREHEMQNEDSSQLLAPKSNSLPQFFILGAPKCGTTSLYSLLLNHPQICKTKIKETQFFIKDSLYSLSYAFYSSFFFKDEYCDEKRKSEKDKLYFIDSTPDYLRYNSVVMPRMLETYGKEELNNKKYIIALRDPVYREYSWYNHLVRICSASMKNYMKNEIIRISRVTSHTLFSSNNISNSSRNLEDTFFSSFVPKNGWNVTELCEDNHCDDLNCKKYARFAKINEEKYSLSSFEEYYKDNKINYYNGKYFEQIKNVLNYINRENLFIFNSETIFEDKSNEILMKLTRFLNIENIYDHDYDEKSKIKLKKNKYEELKREKELYKLPFEVDKIKKLKTKKLNNNRILNEITNKNVVKFPHKNQARVVTNFSCFVRDELYPIYENSTKALYEFMRETQKIYHHEPKFVEFKDMRCTEEERKKEMEEKRKETEKNRSAKEEFLLLK